MFRARLFVARMLDCALMSRAASVTAPVPPIDGQWVRLPRDAEVWVRIPRDT